MAKKKAGSKTPGSPTDNDFARGFTPFRIEILARVGQGFCHAEQNRGSASQLQPVNFISRKSITGVGSSHGATYQGSHEIPAELWVFFSAATTRNFHFVQKHHIGPLLRRCTVPRVP